ncbi:ABC transporter permease subunit [Mycoplasma elephantis]|uniref:ABC transporter permease subunit n=1 Tax=Mycoplasma elephantis TaxID=114882 RepID=UPI000482C7E3|nr:ABC transporter permease subunit [Mycoplasma elephantis]
MRFRKHDSKSKVKLNSNLFKYFIESPKAKTNIKILPIYKRLLIFLFVAIIVILFALQNWNFRFNNFELIWERIKNIFSFDKNSNFLTGSFSYEYDNLWFLSFKYLYITFKYALVGTFIGFILAIITSFLSYKNINNKKFAYFIKLFILFLRAIPELVFIRIFSMTFRNEVCLLFIYIWFTWLWLHKYYIELLESIDLKAYKISMMQGNSRYKAFRDEILSRAKNKFFSLFLFSFESNVKWTSILSALSLPGIGILLKKGYSSTEEFKQLGIPLFVLITFIIFLEIINIIFKKYLFEAKSKKINFEENMSNKNKYLSLSKKRNIRSIVLFIFFLLIIVYSIYVLIDIKFLIHNMNAIKLFVTSLFKPNWNSLNLNSTEFSKNSFLMLLKCFEFSILCIVIVAILTILFVRFASIKLTNNNYYPFISRCIFVLIRTIPIIVMFYIFKPLFDSPFILLIILIGIQEATNLIKQVVETIDNLSEQKIAYLKMQGYSNNFIFRNFIFPSIKKDFYSLLSFYFELIFRNTITYSMFVGEEMNFGNMIWTSLDNVKSYHPDIAAAYIWFSTISIIIINLSSSYMKKYIQNQH